MNNDTKKITQADDLTFGQQRQIERDLKELKNRGSLADDSLLRTLTSSEQERNVTGLDMMLKGQQLTDGARARMPEFEGVQPINPDNLIMMTDGYKHSHAPLFPKNMTRLTAYLEARGGNPNFTVFFGLQYALWRFLSRPVTEGDLIEAEEANAAYGVNINLEGWKRIVREFGGHLPLEIRAVPEGSVVPYRNVLMTVTNTHDDFAWLVGWVETLLQRAVWYPTTVASISRYCREQILRPAMEQSSDDPEAGLPFKLHDFGARGVSSPESAGIGGGGHLVSFEGSDTEEAIVLLRNYYGAQMPASSIPAMEHNTIISWGREHEADAYRNALNTYAKPGGIVAIVADSYDLKNAVNNLIGGELREQIINSGATVVVRPDSGNPIDMVRMVLKLLDARFGHTVNSKGYRVLNHVRVIQGDGINPDTMRDIVEMVLAENYSLDNVAFGMGGGLLQKVDRDTQRFAYKGSAALIDGQVVPIYKDPVTEPGKRSKDGVLDLVKDDNGYRTVRHDSFEQEQAARSSSALVTVYKNGEIAAPQHWDDIKKRSNA